MSKYAKMVVEQAKYWLGCKESDGSHKKIIDVYNSHKPLARGWKVRCKANGDGVNDPWCATFVSAVSVQLGYTDIIPTECSCTKMIELFKNLGAWAESDSRVPNPGDILFYDWDDDGKGENTGDPEHVGIVEKVSGNTITIIEGNYSKSVKRRTLAVNGKYIRGYGVPKYDKEATKTVEQLAKEVIDGKWSTGADRKKKLTDAGYDYNAVQNKVNEILLGGKKTVSQIADEVIQGKWGVGQKRKQRLLAAGYNPTEVQKEVNRKLKA
jgi:hypothetical protein